MSTYFLPGIGGQISSEPGPYQSSPLLNTYSPRLFGSPPQLTNHCDMRLMSSKSGGSTPGPVGDFYLTKILQDAQIANFCVGRALFTGGSSSIANVIRVTSQYLYALKKYGMVDNSGNMATGASTSQAVSAETSLNTYNKAIESDTKGTATVTNDGGVKSQATGLISDISNIISVGGSISAVLLDSLSVQQPFYTFESDWYTYINNVKMMINTAVIMLGLQSACVKIGDMFYPIGTSAKVTKDSDVWSNYRYITPTSNIGTVTGLDTQSGDTSQYVSFMIDPAGTSESFTNEVSDSQLYSEVISKGSTVGNEIAFITNSSPNKLDDAVINIAKDSVTAAQTVLTKLSAGTGRFTAAIAGSMARSFTGDHTIYPKVFQSSNATSEFTIKTKLTASSGDPYAYLTEMLVPYFFILGMVLPNMSKNGPSAYAYPPLVQCNIPGMWGTRLGMVTAVSVTKSQNDISVHGWPLSINVDITVTDLQHTLVTSGMDKVSTFINNSTMFDYIAQCAGVDRYRVNGSIRLISKLALASSASGNYFNNVGNAIATDFTSFANRMAGTSRM